MGTPIFRLPTILESVAPTRDARVAQAATNIPSAPVAEPGDVVARALVILAEESVAWQARRAANPSPRSAH